jgi:glycosyltransferase involved in cell wall biosynthesis
MKVLHVVDNLGMGGAETWLMELLRFWHRNGSSGPQFDFVATGGIPTYYDEEAKKYGSNIFYLRYGRAHLASFVSGFRKILRNGQYCAIHDHGDYASGWHFVIGAGLLPPVRVAHVHNPWGHIAVNYAVSPGRRFAAGAGKALVEQFATHVCGTSAVILRKYGFESARLGPPEIKVVHCGFDVGKFNRSRQSDRVGILGEFGWPSQTKLVLFAGRLDRALELDHPTNHKNSWLALNIVKEALARDPSVRLIMAGAGESRPALQDRVRAWGLEDELRLPGIRNDIPALMTAADILLFPSAQEGLGMVAVEAQAAGLPVLASTAVPREAIVMPELVESLPLSEPVDHWAAVLLEAMAVPRVPADECRRILDASPFSIENSARNLLQIYRGACGAESRAA